MKKEIQEALVQKMKGLQSGGAWPDFIMPEFAVERPKDYTHGDYTVNLGFILAKKVGKDPLEITQEISADLVIGGIKKIESTGGYINFSLEEKMRLQMVGEILSHTDDFGKNSRYEGEKIMVEYTDPNPFKVFHIGHLMPNVIGESVATLLEFSGADVVRANYQGDIGRHVAMALWGMQKKETEMPAEGSTLQDKTAYLGACYAHGSKAFEEDENAKAEIIVINKAVYERSDDALNELYTKGRTWSLEKFEEIYEILGTSFDEYFFESETWEKGREIVEAHVPDIFEESDGAIIFDGEKFGLHKRVFINSAGLTTYEAKDLGLAYIKKERCACDHYIMVTAVEQKPYFQVVFRAIEAVDDTFSGKLENVAHGLLQLKSGKMSSRTGNVISGEEMISEAQALAAKKMSEKTESTVDDSLKNQIAIAGIKFSILKQAIEKNSIYDHEEALSFEGDSGPYLQYTYVRTASVMRKMHGKDIAVELQYERAMHEIVYLLSLFPETVEKAAQERSPHYVANYLTQLARAYNSYYANTKIISDEEISASRIALTGAVGHVMKNGLHVLAIAAPERM